MLLMVAGKRTRPTTFPTDEPLNKRPMHVRQDVKASTTLLRSVTRTAELLPPHAEKLNQSLHTAERNGTAKIRDETGVACHGPNAPSASDCLGDLGQG